MKSVVDWNMNATIYSNNPPLLKKYLEGNGIVDAFVWKEGRGEWQVLEGKSVELTGFLAETFKTKREAVKLRDKINEVIKSLNE